MTSIAYLDLADFLAIAELVLDTPAGELAAYGRLELAASALAAPGAVFGDVEPYPTVPLKAAVLCTRIVKNHPLLDGNKRRIRLHGRVLPPQRSHLDAAGRR